MALLTITLNSHKHTHPPLFLWEELWQSLTWEGGPSLSVFGLAPHYSTAKTNVRSVMELQFTWAHTFQLIRTSTCWLTCEQLFGGGGWLKAAEHEVTHRKHSTNKPAAGQPEGPDIIRIKIFTESAAHLYHLVLNKTAIAQFWLTWLLWLVCFLYMTCGPKFTLE